MQVCVGDSRIQEMEKERHVSEKELHVSGSGGEELKVDVDKRMTREFDAGQGDTCNTSLRGSWKYMYKCGSIGRKIMNSINLVGRIQRHLPLSSLAI